MLASLLRERTEIANSPYVFPKERNDYLKDTGTISRRIQKFFTKCGIATTKKPENGHRHRAIVEVGFHSLRHSFVSLCAANRVPQVAIMELVGHSSPAMTRLYSHSGDEQKVKAIAGLPSIKFSDD